MKITGLSSAVATSGADQRPGPHLLDEVGERVGRLAVVSGGQQAVLGSGRQRVERQRALGVGDEARPAVARSAVRASWK